MSRKPRDETLAVLESTQAALRKNIEDSKELIAKSEKLLDRHRAEQAQVPSGQAPTSGTDE